MWPVLLLLSAGTVLGEPVPESSLRELEGKILSHAEWVLTTPRPLEGFSFRIDKNLFGFIPLKFRVEAQSVSLIGPTEILPLGLVRGKKSEDGKTLFLDSRLELHDTTVLYNNFVIEFYNFKYEGSAELRQSISTASLSLRIEHDNILAGNFRTVSSVTEPQGQAIFYLGKPKTVPYYLSIFIDLVVFFTTKYYKFDESFFPSVQIALMDAIDSYKLQV